MYNFKPIYKSALSILVKIIVLLGAGYFIYSRLFESGVISSKAVFKGLKISFLKNKVLFLLAISLSVFNWLLEILKWYILVNTQQKITFAKTAQQSLSALTASMITPNRLGDYVAKSLYFDKDKTSKIIALNFVGHGFQLLTTVGFGVLGFVYLTYNYPINISGNRAVIILLIGGLILVFSFNTVRKGLRKLLNFYKKQSLKIFLKISSFSVLRYLIFSHQFYFWLLILGLKSAYAPLMMAIFSMYLLASIWPSISLTDWAVKGSAAIFVFGFLGVSPLLVMQVTLLMWFFNFALPAIIGGVFVMQFKALKKTS